MIPGSVILIMALSAGCSDRMKSGSGTMEAFSVAGMDPQVRPGDDFYEYVNGTWNASHPIPEDKSSYDAFEEVMEKNREDLKQIVMEDAGGTDGANRAIHRKVRDFYESGMDSSRIEALGIDPLADVLARIDGIGSVGDVQEVAAYLQTSGLAPFFYIFSNPDFDNSEMMMANIYQSGLGLPDRDYYLKTDSATMKIRSDYLDHINRMFAMMDGQSGEDSGNAATIMDIETRLASASFTRVENQDPHKTSNRFTIAQIEEIAPGFDWSSFLDHIGYPDITEVNVFQPPFVKELGKMMKEVPVRDWKTFLRWKVIHRSAPYLSRQFVDENFNFYGKTFSGAQSLRPRWKRVLDVTNRNLGEAIGQLYVEKYFPPEAKERMLALVDNLKKSLRMRIENLEWMGPQTKEEALAKLDSMIVKVGYPDEWRDYSDLDVQPGDYMGNVVRSARFEFAYDMDKVGKPVDKKEWGMSPQTVNAYYNPAVNEIVFPAGILQPPFFNLGADDAINYGAIGMVIGHEMTHGFDNQGRQYDKDGNLRNWWTDQDAKEFEAHASVLVDQYNHYEVLDSEFINGQLTLGENIADLGGATVAYHAYLMSLGDGAEPEPIDGFTGEQRFFLGFAQVWRGTRREQSLRMALKVNPHSPGKYRVNGIVFNMPEFYAAFPDIGPGDSLYIPEDKRAVIW